VASRIETRIQAVANKHLRSIHSAQCAVERAQASVNGKVRTAVNALIETCKLEGLTGAAIVEAIDGFFLTACVARGALGESARANYKTSLRMALALNREFTPALFTDKFAQAEYAKVRGVAGKGLAASKRKEHSPGASTGASTGAKVTQVSANAESVKPEILGRRVTVVAPDSADLAMIAPMLADIVSQPARLALFCDWYKSTFAK
jgi:hypothetical protein